MLKNPTNYGNNMRTSIREVVTHCELQRIQQEVSHSICSAVNSRSKLIVEASISSVRRVIRTAKHLRRLKLKKKTLQL